MRADFLCLDCAKDTLIGDEYYMVHDELWLQVVDGINSGMLCFDCLEIRIDRPLSVTDFTEFPVNTNHRTNPRFKGVSQ